MAEATAAGLRKRAIALCSLLLDDGCGTLLIVLLDPEPKPAAWPRVGKRARIELVIYPVPADELQDAGGVSSRASWTCIVPCVCRALICCFPLPFLCVCTTKISPNRLPGCLEEPNKEHESPHQDSTMKLLSSSRVVHLLLQLAANI